MDHLVKKTQHENKLNQLSQLEERMIQELNKTMITKTKAYDNLKATSPAMIKAMEPRQAYKTNKGESPRFTGTMTSEAKLEAFKKGML